MGNWLSPAFDVVYCCNPSAAWPNQQLSRGILNLRHYSLEWSAWPATLGRALVCMEAWGRTGNMSSIGLTSVNAASEQQQRCEMRRTEITAQEFFDTANEMAREDRSYEPGSKIVPTADGYELVGSWMGTETLVRAIHGLYQNSFVKGRD